MEDSNEKSDLNHINILDDENNKSENSLNNPDFTPFIREGKNKYQEGLKYVNEEEAISPANWKPAPKEIKKKSRMAQACGRGIMRIIFLLIELAAFGFVVGYYVYRMVFTTAIVYRFVYFYNFERDMDITYTVTEVQEMRAVLVKVNNITDMNVSMSLSSDNVSYEFNKYIDCKGRMDIFDNRTMADLINGYISGISCKVGIICMLAVVVVMCLMKVAIAITTNKNEVPFIFKKMIKSRWMFENMLQLLFNFLIASILFLPLPLHSFDSSRNCLVGRFNHSVETMYRMFYSSFVCIMFTCIPLLFLVLYGDSKVFRTCIFIILIILMPAFLYIIGMGNYVAFKVILSYYSEQYFVWIFIGIYCVLGESLLMNVIYSIHSNIESKRAIIANQLAQIVIKESKATEKSNEKAKEKLEEKPVEDVVPSLDKVSI